MRVAEKWFLKGRCLYPSRVPPHLGIIMSDSQTHLVAHIASIPESEIMFLYAWNAAMHALTRVQHSASRRCCHECPGMVLLA